MGKALSQDLGWPFEDLDDRLESREGRTVEQIFRESGEQAFRRAETAALRELLDELGPAPKIVALGGGAFVQRENAEFLERADVTWSFSMVRSKSSLSGAISSRLSGPCAGIWNNSSNSTK